MHERGVPVNDANGVPGLGVDVVHGLVSRPVSRAPTLRFCVAILLGLGSGYYALTDMMVGGPSGAGGISDLQQVLTRSDACCETNRDREQT